MGFLEGRLVIYPTIAWEDAPPDSEVCILGEDRGDGDQWTLCGVKLEQRPVRFDRVPGCKDCIREVYELRLKLMAGGLP